MNLLVGIKKARDDAGSKSYLRRFYWFFCR